MLLLIDAGNTRIKWALVNRASPEGGELGHWYASGVVGNDDVVLLAHVWDGHLVSRVLISNVAGEILRDQFKQILMQTCGAVTLEWFASVPALAGLRNGYRNPSQLGCDRFASAIGARALFPNQSLIVVNCGTATTIDAITADGLFVGGLIVPGLRLMAASLAQNTAQLPSLTQSLTLELFDNLCSDVLADNTEDAIGHGCAAAQAGAIERAFAAHVRSGGAVVCVLTGGAASTIAPALSMASSRVENLVLIGLHAVAMLKRKQEVSC